MTAANINKDEKYSRAELKKKFDTLLLRFFGSSPIAPADCEPRIERQIQAVVRPLRFDSPDKKSEFIQKLRLACMLYWLLPGTGVTFERRSEALRHAKALSDLGYADYLSKRARNSLELRKYELPVWKQRDAEDFLALELDILFRSFGFKWRLPAIADLTATTFDLRKGEKGRNGGLGAEWVRKEIFKAEKKSRDFVVFVALPSPQGDAVFHFVVPVFTRPREAATDVSKKEFCATSSYSESS